MARINSDGKPYGGQYDELRVYTEDLAKVMKRWRYEYEQNHPISAKELRRGQEHFYPVMQKMEELTGYDGRILRRIMSAQWRTISFWTADKILRRLEMEHKLYDGSIRICDAHRFIRKL